MNRMNNMDWWIDWMNERGLALRRKDGVAYHEDMYNLIAETKRRERERWLSKIRHIHANTPITGNETTREMMRSLVEEMDKSIHGKRCADMKPHCCSVDRDGYVYHYCNYGEDGRCINGCGGILKSELKRFTFLDVIIYSAVTQQTHYVLITQTNE